MRLARIIIAGNNNNNNNIRLKFTPLDLWRQTLRNTWDELVLYYSSDCDSSLSFDPFKRKQTSDIMFIVTETNGSRSSCMRFRAVVIYEAGIRVQATRCTAKPYTFSLNSIELNKGQMETSEKRSLLSWCFRRKKNEKSARTAAWVAKIAGFLRTSLRTRQT